MAKVAADRYAEALFELAVEQNCVQELFEEVKAAEEILDRNPEFCMLLTHPKISKEEKHEVVEKTFRNRADDRLTGLLLVLVDKGRCAELRSVLDEFLAKVYEYLRIGKATVTSATELSDTQKKSIEQKLLSQTDYKSFEMTFLVDEALIGGMTIRIGDRIVDSSIRSKLSKMAASLSKLQLSV